MTVYSVWRSALESALPKLYRERPDGELTVAEILDIAPELRGLARDMPEALTRRSPVHAGGFILQRWHGTNPRKFHIRKLEA